MAPDPSLLGQLEALALISGAVALVVAALFIMLIRRAPAGNPKMRRIAQAIQEGANAYLKRQYRVVFLFVIVIALAFAVLFRRPDDAAYGTKLAAGFVVGAAFSALAGYVGMTISTTANVRTAEAARKGVGPALRIAARGGAVTGLFVVGLGLLGVTGFYLLYGRDPNLIVGFAFGASLISLFARVGGGIYTKAADVGADLVGKVEAGIPEDDPRNPAVIADNVGDNVGDCAGMAADLFETYAVTLIAAMLLGYLLFPQEARGTYTLYPIALGAIGIIGSILGPFAISTDDPRGILGALNRGVGVSAIVSLGGFYIVTLLLGLPLALFGVAVIGVLVTVALMAISFYYTAVDFAPVKETARASQTGAGTNLIAGLAIGLEATVLPLLVLVVGVLSSYFLGQLAFASEPALQSAGGLYGIALAAMSMLSMTGVIVTLDSYGPITDNAGGIAEMAGLPTKVRVTTDGLDAIGNTTKAVTKAYAVGSAVLGALALFVAYTEEMRLVLVSAPASALERLGDSVPGMQYNAVDGTLSGSPVMAINNPTVLVGLLIGAMLPFWFSSLAMRAVGRTAGAVVTEVRRQFKELRIMEGEDTPDYARCVDIVTASAQREMVIPALLAVLSPIIVGLFLGPLALGGVLMGVIISGVLVAVFMTTAGATWDNAKKYVEQGHYGGKGSPTHAAAVVGDTVGDPFKDTAGPAINPLIKVINTIAILTVGVIIPLFFGF